MSAGGKNAVYSMLGASNHGKRERAQDDYYATPPSALERLLDEETFSHDIWEPACGGGHLSEVLAQRGYNVISTDLVDRGYGVGGIDFLTTTLPDFEGDIITNPPYKYAMQFVTHAIDVITEGHRVAMLLRLQFLEGKARRKIFAEHPPAVIYVSTSRINCAVNGDFGRKDNTSAVAYAWFIWEKPFEGETVVRWFN